jgi:hypothetical protein
MNWTIVLDHISDVRVGCTGQYVCVLDSGVFSSSLKLHMSSLKPQMNDAKETLLQYSKDPPGSIDRYSFCNRSTGSDRPESVEPKTGSDGATGVATLGCMECSGMIDGCDTGVGRCSRIAPPALTLTGARIADDLESLVVVRGVFKKTPRNEPWGKPILNVDIGIAALV